MNNAVSVYQQLYKKAYQLIENKNYDLAYKAFDNLLHTLRQDTSQYPEDKLHVNELIVEVLLSVAFCKTHIVNLNPNDDSEFSQNISQLKQAFHHAKAAKEFFHSDSHEFQKSSTKGIQESITSTFNTIDRVSAAVNYNYGHTLLEKAHQLSCTVSESISFINIGFQRLLDAISLYNQLNKTTPTQIHQNDFQITHNTIYQTITGLLNLLTTNTALIEKKQTNEHYRKEFTALKECYEKMLELNEKYPNKLSSSLNLILHEKIADICSILSNDNDRDLIKLAIYHYEYSIDKNLSNKDEKNIKICLSILGCYESLMNIAHIPKEKIKYAYKIFYFMKQHHINDLSQLDPADALELSSIQFITHKTLAIHGRTIKFANQFLKEYENFADENPVKQNFSQIYQVAKDYVKNVAESKEEESDKVSFKRKSDPQDDTTRAAHENDKCKFFKSTASGTKIKFHNLPALYATSVADCPRVASQPTHTPTCSSRRLS